MCSSGRWSVTQAQWVTLPALVVWSQKMAWTVSWPCFRPVAQRKVWTVCCLRFSGFRVRVFSGWRSQASRARFHRAGVRPFFSTVMWLQPIWRQRRKNGSQP